MITNPSFSIIGLEFHWYGLIMGLAVGVGIWLSEKKVRQSKLDEHLFRKGLLGLLIGGLIGARLWHVGTDFHLYHSNLVSALFIWQGGLSMFGAIAGGLMGAWVVLRRNSSQFSVKQLLDVAIFGLPFAQAIGRLGNYVNQELYGLPTNLPWAITIDAKFRLPGYELITQYHPLFLYEALLMLAFGLWMWLVGQQWLEKRGALIGSGRLFLLYLVYYLSIRFLLDFLRLDKTLFLSTSLGINQVLILLMFVSLVIWAIARQKN